MNITQKPSPNFTVDPTFKPIGFCIHGTLGSYEGAINWLCTPPAARVPVSYSSAHYVIAKDGRCTQLVSEKNIAWHAGVVNNPTAYAASVLPKVLGVYKNPNSSFIGIELEWFVGDVVTEAQIAAVCQIIANSGIKNPVVLSHKEITDYKGDFTTKDGKIDMTAVLEIRKRITPAAPAPVVDKAAIKAEITKLINLL